MRVYLIHGFLENPKMWDFTSQLDVAFTRLSLPGHGDWIERPCPGSMEEIAQEILAQINTNEPYGIIGHSMGGYLLGELIHQGARPQWIGLFHSKLSEDEPSKKEQRLRAIDLVVENKNLYIRTMISNLFPEAFKVKKYHIIDDLVRDAFQIETTTIQQCQRAMMNRKGHLKWVESLQIPVHYFGGSVDTSVTQKDIEQEHKQFSLAQVKQVDGIGHMGQWECPEIALEWIQSLCP
jgi:surfactin synthase thioesterase subunit